MSRPPRPYVVANCATSLDGFLDDASPERLILSNDEDLDRVDALRAECDAILVGAETVRQDNPRLLVRSAARRQERRAAGRPDSPGKVTLTTGGKLDPSAAFFTAGEAERLVYCPTRIAADVRSALGDVTAVVDGGDPLDMGHVLADLSARGVERLLVEGGSTLLTSVLAGGFVDELYVAVAPFFVGDAAAPRFVRPADFPRGPANPLRLAGARTMGDVVLLHYSLADA